MHPGLRCHPPHRLDPRRRTERTVTRGRAALRAVVVAVALATAPLATADDTEVFFAGEPGADAAAPNVLFVLPAGRTMGCVIGSHASCETAVEDGNSRMDVMKAALMKALDRLADEGVNVGLMRGNNNGRDAAAAARGGFVAQEVVPLTKERRDELARWICPFGMDRRECRHVVPGSGDAAAGQLMLAPSNHPGFCTVDGAGAPDCRDRLGPGRQALAELLFEANRYFAGRRPAWGADSTIGPGYSFPGNAHDPSSIWGPATVAAADCREAGPACRYRSPAGDCQRNVLVILSDGVLAEDRGNDAGAGSIANSAGDPAAYDRWFRAYRDPRGLTAGLDPVGCSINAGIDYRLVDPSTGKASRLALSDCSDDLAYSMRNGGFVADRRQAQVFTHTVAFDLTAATRAEGIPEDAPRSLLQLLARAGGGKHHSVDCGGCTPAEAADRLATVLTGIVREAVIANASFAAPAVPVNSFNRTENLDDLYLSVFRPASGERWKGNVKKYRLAPNGDILGRGDALAVNALTGRFLPDVGSLWPPDPRRRRRRRRPGRRGRKRPAESRGPEDLHERGRRQRARARHLCRRAGRPARRRRRSARLPRRGPGAAGLSGPTGRRASRRRQPGRLSPDRLDPRRRRGRPVPGATAESPAGNGDFTEPGATTSATRCTHDRRGS